MSRWLCGLFSAGFVAFVGCAGSETAVGKGGFDFTDGVPCIAGNACEVPDQLGACAVGVLVCSPEGDSTCEGPAPAAETCNGIDDSCDGVIDEQCPLTFQHFLPTGDSSGPATTSAYPVNGSATKAVLDVLPSDPGDGWLRVTSESPLPVGGTVLSYPQATGPVLTLSPSVSPDRAAKKIVVPTYRQAGPGPAFSHSFSIVNVGTGPATVTVGAVPDGGVLRQTTVSIPKDGLVRSNVPLLFSIDPAVAEEGWLSIDSDQDVVVAYEEGRSDFQDGAGDAGWAPPTMNLVLPYFHANATVVSTLRIANPSASEASVTVRAHKQNAEILESPPIAVATMTRNAQSLEAMFPGGFVTGERGWIEISSTAAVTAHVLVENMSLAGMALVSPVHAPATVLYAAGVVIDPALGKTQEILLANPGTEAVTAALQGFFANGDSARQTSIVIAAGSANLVAPDAAFGLPAYSGWIRVVADRPIAGALVQQGGAPGVGVTALLDKLGDVAIVPSVRSAAIDQTLITLIQPERRSF
jgi:hypothetical protein